MFDSYWATFWFAVWTLATVAYMVGSLPLMFEGTKGMDTTEKTGRSVGLLLRLIIASASVAGLILAVRQ